MTEPFVVDLVADGQYKRLLAGSPQTCGMRSGLVRLMPGESCGEHSTGAHEEALVILEGEGKVSIQGKAALEITGGNIAYIPPDTFHDVKNMGSTVLRYVYVVAPAQAEVSK